MLISGEPGIGKSRLTAALSGAHRNRAAYPPALFLLAAPSGQRALSGHRAARTRRRLRPRRRARESWTSCATLLAPAAEAGDISLLAELLSLPGGVFRATRAEPAAQEGAHLRGVAAAARRAGSHATGADDLRGSALDRPDLARVARPHPRRGSSSLPVLLVATFRPEFQPPWAGQPHVTVMALNRLGRTRWRGDGRSCLPATPACCRRRDRRDRRAHRRRAAVRRGDDQGRARERRCRGGRDCCVGAPASPRARRAGDVAGLADGAARPARAGGKRSPRSAPRSAANSPTSWSAPVARTRRRKTQAALDRLVAAGLVFQRGTPPGPSTCSSTRWSGHRLWHAAARAAPGTARPDRGRVRNRFPRARRTASPSSSLSIMRRPGSLRNLSRDWVSVCRLASCAGLAD